MSIFIWTVIFLELVGCEIRLYNYNLEKSGDNLYVRTVDGENADLVSLEFIKSKKNLKLVKEIERNQIFFVTDKTSHSSAK